MIQVEWLKKEDVKDPGSFAGYCQQMIGTPYPGNPKQWGILRAQMGRFFETYPHVNYEMLCRVADWVANTKMKPSAAWVVTNYFRTAWIKGVIPELADATFQALNKNIEGALAIETDEEWRSRLLCAYGPSAKASVFRDWQAERQSSDV